MAAVISAGEAAARYDRVAVALHWIIALFILGQIGLGWYMVDLPKGGADRTYFYALHKSMGITTAFLILLRVAWRLTHQPPPLPAWLPAWQALAAQWTHRLLYACLVVMPVSGYLSASFTKYPMKWFGMPILKAGWESDFINAVFNGIHVGTSWLFAALLALHIGAGLKHLLAGDGVFRRILP
ncbi:MAG TPA: cytochrome b [Burkholderiales bacterium]